MPPLTRTDIVLVLDLVRDWQIEVAMGRPLRRWKWELDGGYDDPKPRMKAKDPEGFFFGLEPTMTYCDGGEGGIGGSTEGAVQGAEVEGEGDNRDDDDVDASLIEYYTLGGENPLSPAALREYFRLERENGASEPVDWSERHTIGDQFKEFWESRARLYIWADIYVGDVPFQPDMMPGPGENGLPDTFCLHVWRPYKTGTTAFPDWASLELRKFRLIITAEKRRDRSFLEMDWGQIRENYQYHRPGKGGPLFRIFQSRDHALITYCNGGSHHADTWIWNSRLIDLRTPTGGKFLQQMFRDIERLEKGLPVEHLGFWRKSLTAPDESCPKAEQIACGEKVRAYVFAKWQRPFRDRRLNVKLDEELAHSVDSMADDAGSVRGVGEGEGRSGLGRERSCCKTQGCRSRRRWRR